MSEREPGQTRWGSPAEEVFSSPILQMGKEKLDPEPGPVRTEGTAERRGGVRSLVGRVAGLGLCSAASDLEDEG